MSVVLKIVRDEIVFTCNVSEDRPSIAQNFAKFTFLLQSSQPAITFPNFLRGARG